jgi:RHS repeat-associated protein
VWTSPDGTKVPFPVETKSGCSADVSSNDAFASDASGYHMWVSNFTQAYVINTTGNQLYDVPRDNNGNYVTQNSNGDAIDTLNRVPVTTTVSGNQTFLDVLSSQNTTNRYTLNYTNINVSTAFGESGVTEYSGSVQVLSSVQLPNGTSYTFTYDSYGELATITLPTGGLLSYGYTNFSDSYGQMNRWISSRTTVGGQWSYVPSVISTCSNGSQNCQQKVVVTKPSNDSIQYTFTMNGGAWNSQAVYYDHSGAQLATVTKDYNLSNTCSGCTGAAYVTNSRHTTTLISSGGSVSKKTEYTYNATWNSLVTAVKDWNFYTGTPNSTPDRETDIVYVNDDAHLSKNMLNLPTSVTVKNAAGTQLSQTQYTYDRYDLTGLADVPGVVQHDSAFDISRTTRGNVTTVQKWVSGTTYLTWKYWYDITGHVTQSADPAGNITTYSYADNFYTDTGANPPSSYSPSGVTNAYLTKTTLPIIGSQTSGYYFGNGGSAFSTDQNGAMAYSHYLDPLNRPTTSIDAAGGWVLMSYSSATQTDTYTGINDSTPSAGCTSCRHDQVTVDGIGRRIRSSLISDPDGTTLTDTSYDVSGRPGAVSNPYRSTTDPTYGSTTSIYDGLDRIIQVIRPDNNAVTISYGAAAGSVSQLCSAGTYGTGYPVLSTSESGKKRLTWYSGFDKIIEVDEPNSLGALSVATCYKYDALNNLIAVAQQSENRSYAYDGISRVTSSSIPESGTTTFSYTSGGNPCSGNPANACNHTDARGITTTYAYDALNRVTQKSYSDSTPTVNYEYDQSSVWGVSLSNTKGRVSHASSGNSEKLFSYDAAGRLVQQTECLPSNCGTSTYNTTLTYNRGGNVITINYPSTRQITYAYTNAGRISSVTGTSMHGAAQNYSYASGLTYAPNGGPKALPLNGTTGLTESYNYNNRFQLTSQQLATSSATFMNHSLSYADASSHDDGNVMSVVDNLNSARTQSFTYDPLNRLATATETNWGLGYVYDVYGNLLQQNVTAGSAPSLNVTVNTNNQITGTGFSYDAAGHLTSDGTNTYVYNGANQLASLNGGAGSYTYDYNGLRVRKDVGSSYTEYIRVGSNVIAENTANGWSDYVFLGKRRLARADDYYQDLRIYGTNSSTGQYALFYWGNLGAANNYTIRSGDRLYLWQYQFTGSKGGMILTFSDGTSSGWTVKDQDGYYLNDDQTQGTYHSRAVDLTSLAGKTITKIAANSENDTAVGSWIILYGQIALVSADGTVRPLYNGQSSSPIGSVAGTSGETGLGNQIDRYTGQGGNAIQTTTYYHGDHVGSARMMTSGNGYPIWQATYLPFGYEYNPQLTVNHYKFSGYEHDDESGLENANDRMLSSQLARFTSPDPLAGSLSNPQSLNKYSYAANNPLRYVDPSGADPCDDGYDGGCEGGGGGVGGGGGGGFWSTVGSFFSNAWNDVSSSVSSVASAIGDFFSPPNPSPTDPPLTESVTSTCIQCAPASDGSSGSSSSSNTGTSSLVDQATNLVTPNIYAGTVTTGASSQSVYYIPSENSVVYSAGPSIPLTGAGIALVAGHSNNPMGFATGMSGQACIFEGVGGCAGGSSSAYAYFVGAGVGGWAVSGGYGVDPVSSFANESFQNLPAQPPTTPTFPAGGLQWEDPSMGIPQ